MERPFAGRRVLVVGGAGFVGANLVRELLAQGAAAILVVDNLLSAERANLPQADPVTSLEGSITDEAILAGILAKAGAAPSTVVGMGADPVVLTDLSDLLRLFAILLAALHFGVSLTEYSQRIQQVLGHRPDGHGRRFGRRGRLVEGRKSGRDKQRRAQYE